MNLVRKVICIALAVCTMSTACVVFAADSNTAEKNEGQMVVQTGTGEEISPLTSRIAVDAAIRESGVSWTQPIGYGSYRIWVDNTTNKTMVVTITGGFGEKSHTFSVPKKSNKSLTVNDAGWGKHTVSFDNDSGEYSGTVRVRISDATLV